MIAGAHKRIVNTVSSWAGVETAPHRFGGTEFRLGTRELGHIHGNALVDIPFPKRIRNEIVDAGLAEPHHVLPESGWISRWLRDESDVDQAIDLLRRSWELAQNQRERLVGEG
ncbi:MAG: luciferase family protein [Candidatus Kapaibacterium sp.]